MGGHTRDPVIYSKFHRNPFKDFGTPGGQNLALPITLASRFYNSLYYRTSRDSCNMCSTSAWIFRYGAAANANQVCITSHHSSITAAVNAYVEYSLAEDYLMLPVSTFSIRYQFLGNLILGRLYYTYKDSNASLDALAIFK